MAATNKDGGAPEEEAGVKLVGEVAKAPTATEVDRLFCYRIGAISLKSSDEMNGEDEGGDRLAERSQSSRTVNGYTSQFG